MKMCRDCPKVINHNETRCYPCTDKHRTKRRGYTADWYKAMTPEGLCFWGCGRPATQRDHYTPLSEGGDHAPHNIVYACQPCNGTRNGQRGDPRG